MLLSELFKDIPEAERRGDIEVLDITHDSRQIQPGWLFAAMRGTTTDGHLYAKAAKAAGASALLVEHWLDLDLPQIKVASVRAQVGTIASKLHNFPSKDLKIVGITGTNGKTTTAFLLEKAFKQMGWTTGLIGTIETRIGDKKEPSLFTTPEASDLQRILERMVKEQVRVVSIEVSSHGLDQHRLDGTKFEVSVFTNLTPEHLDYHGTIEHYYATKALLFTPELTKSAVICVDDDWGKRLAYQTKVPLITFGLYPGADVRVEIISSDLSGSVIHIFGQDLDHKIKTPLIGKFNAINITGAFLAALKMGVDPEVAIEGMSNCRDIPGRFELVDKGQPFLIIVDYAHTPNALRGLIETVKSLKGPQGKIYVVVGSRGGRDRLKRQDTGRAAATADIVVFTSDNPGPEDPSKIIAEMKVGTLDIFPDNLVVELDRRKAITFAIQDAKAGDVILIVGRGHEKVQHLKDRSVSFDDRKVAVEALASLGYE